MLKRNVKFIVTALSAALSLTACGFEMESDTEKKLIDFKKSFPISDGIEISIIDRESDPRIVIDKNLKLIAVARYSGGDQYSVNFMKMCNSPEETVSGKIPHISVSFYKNVDIRRKCVNT